MSDIKTDGFKVRGFNDGVNSGKAKVAVMMSVLRDAGPAWPGLPVLERGGEESPD
jgi:hypothetical protein